jgi:predicted DNA-binding transcriptional regulator YafY
MGDYQRTIAIFGPGERPGTFDAWCYVYDSFRTYRCERVVKVEELDAVTGDELMQLLWPTHQADR